MTSSPSAVNSISLSGPESDYTAVVTGATGGVGSAVARRLARSGAELFLLGRDGASLRALRAEIEADSSKVVTVRADLQSDTELQEGTKRIREVTDGVDVLVHAAGVFFQSGLEQMDMEPFDELFEVNVRGRHTMTRELLPLLRARRGDVVFINSSRGLRSAGEVGAYSATMHAGRALADALRDEVNDDGVRVLTIYLGRTATPMQQRIHAQDGQPYRPDRLIQPETVAEAVLGAVSLPRDGEITDLTLRPMLKPLPPEPEE